MSDPRIDDTRLDLLVLARIGDSGRQVKKSDVRASLAPLVAVELTPAAFAAHLDERLRHLVEAGLVTATPLRLTDAGAEHLRRGFDAAKRPDWKTVTTQLAPAAALGAPAATARTAASLTAAVLARRIGVADPPATPGAVVDAWIADRLGIARAGFKASALRRPVLVHLGAGKGKDADQLAARLAAAEVRAAKTGAAPLRIALVQRWLTAANADTNANAAAAAGASRPAPASSTSDADTTPDSAQLRVGDRAGDRADDRADDRAADTAPATGADTHEQPLPTLAAAIRDAAARIHTVEDGRFGRKVFIAALWRSLTRDPRFAGIPLERFKQILVAANRDGLVELTRADLVAAMDPALVAASEIDDLGSTFHFVTGDADGRGD